MSRSDCLEAIASLTTKETYSKDEILRTVILMEDYVREKMIKEVIDRVLVKVCNKEKLSSCLKEGDTHTVRITINSNAYNDNDKREIGQRLSEFNINTFIQEGKNFTILKAVKFY